MPGSQVVVNKCTTILFAESIEPSLKFWIDHLGFKNTGEVPAAKGLAFAMLANPSGTVELMYQSFASAEQDAPTIAADTRRGPTFLYLEIEDFDATLAAVRHLPLFLQPRETFYGMREFGVREPAGHYVTFAKKI